MEAFRQGLRELGYVEGQNLVIEWRWAEGREERLPDLAAELVRLQVEVLVVGGVAAIRGTYKGTVRVSDNGSPALSDEETIHVAVTKPGGLQITGATISSPGVINLNWQAEAGKTYQVQFKNDLNEPVWQDAGDPITNYPSAAFTDTTDTASVRFYRIIRF